MSGRKKCTPLRTPADVGFHTSLLFTCSWCDLVRWSWHFWMPERPGVQGSAGQSVREVSMPLHRDLGCVRGLISTFSLRNQCEQSSNRFLV